MRKIKVKNEKLRVYMGEKSKNVYYTYRGLLHNRHGLAVKFEGGSSGIGFKYGMKHDRTGKNGLYTRIEGDVNIGASRYDLHKINLGMDIELTCSMETKKNWKKSRHHAISYTTTED